MSTSATSGTAAESKPKGWWGNASWWGAAGAIAGWGMTGAAIYDAAYKGPEVISLTMTPVMIVYSSLFARWAFIVKPQNLLLCACHVSNVVAQARTPLSPRSKHMLARRRACSGRTPSSFRESGCWLRRMMLLVGATFQW